MNNPFISIIIPVYNIQNYIGKCIESILKQDYESYELIIVDDGSSDKSREICCKYSETDKRIKVFHKEKGGVTSARNLGIVKSTGDYIAFIDGDDWVDSNYISSFVKEIKKYSPDIVCSGAYWAYENKIVEHKIDLPYGYYSKSDIEKRIFPILIENENGEYFTPSLWAKFFKKEIIEKYQLSLDTKIKIGEDNACVKTCIYNSKSIVLIEESLYYYRQNPTSATKKKAAFNWDGPILIAQYFEKNIDMDKFDFQNQVYRNFIHNVFNVAITQFYRKEPYSFIRKEIINKLNEPYYLNALQKCEYNSKYWKGNLALFSLRHKTIFLLWLFNNCKPF